MYCVQRNHGRSVPSIQAASSSSTSLAGVYGVRVATRASLFASRASRSGSRSRRPPPPTGRTFSSKWSNPRWKFRSRETFGFEWMAPVVYPFARNSPAIVGWSSARYQWPP
jgi:hypothetical protein